MLTKYPARKIIQKSAGISTLGGVDIWYDPTIGRLNRDQHGHHIGNFEPNDLILAIYANGNYELTNFELTNRYPAEEILYLKRFNSKSIISAVYFDGINKSNYIKRFKLETTTIDKKFLFITDSKNSKLLNVTDNYSPNVQIKHKPDGKVSETSIIPIVSIVEVRGWKAIGSKLNFTKIADIQFLDTEEIDSTEITESETLNNSLNSDEGSESNSDNNINLLNSKTYENAETIEDESIEEIMEEIEQETDEIPLEIINKESINSEDLDKSKTIVLEEDEIEPLSNTINTDDIPFDINTSNNETDVPLTIKSKPEENSNSDLNKGAQLGLF